MNKFDAEIRKAPNMGAARMELAFDVKEVFGKGRVPVYASFDGEPYVNVGVKHPGGSVCCIIGITGKIFVSGSANNRATRSKLRLKKESNNGRYSYTF